MASTAQPCGPSSNDGHLHSTQSVTGAWGERSTRHRRTNHQEQVVHLGMAGPLETMPNVRRKTGHLPDLAGSQNNRHKV